MKKFYEKVCKLEELIALILVAGIAVWVVESFSSKTSPDAAEPAVEPEAAVPAVEAEEPPQAVRAAVAAIAPQTARNERREIFFM